MSEITDVNDNSFQIEVLDDDNPVLVDFWAEWCAPCKMLSPLLAQIADDYSGRLKVCKANYEEVGDVLSKYNIAALPTICIFKRGQIVSKVVGLISSERITEDIEKALV